MSAKWDATTYHDVANPHVAWGTKVLARLPLRGDETVLDAGCGTGRVTELLLERLPRGRVIALDVDEGMLEQAKKTLARFGDRVTYVHASLLALPSDLRAEAIVSTATFHWVLDHDALFRGLARVLAPGGWLVAQCGGAGNLARIVARLAPILREPRYEPFFRGVRDPWFYATPEETAARLSQLGFVDVETGLQPEPTPFADADAYRKFVSSVIMAQRLAPVRDAALRAEIVERIVELAAKDEPRFVLDYVRLNIKARSPAR